METISNYTKGILNGITTFVGLGVSETVNDLVRARVGEYLGGVHTAAVSRHLNTVMTIAKATGATWWLNTAIGPLLNMFALGPVFIAILNLVLLGVFAAELARVNATEDNADAERGANTLTRNGQRYGVAQEGNVQDLHVEAEIRQPLFQRDVNVD